MKKILAGMVLVWAFLSAIVLISSFLYTVWVDNSGRNYFHLSIEVFVTSFISLGVSIALNEAIKMSNTTRNPK